MGGVRGGETLGSPIAMSIENRDYASWTDRMSRRRWATHARAAHPPSPGTRGPRGGAEARPPRPARRLERASARETAARTAAGAVARKLLSALGIDVFAHVVAIGTGRGASPSSIRVPPRARARVRASLARTPRRVAHERGDPRGGAPWRHARGVFEVVATGVPAGLGSHAQWDRKLDGRLAQALMSIPAIKAVEVGEGFAAARRAGSEVHDAIGYDHEGRRFTRPTNRAGGSKGGSRTASRSSAARS